MTYTDAAWTARGGPGAWIFRILLVAAAAFMAYSWFQPWWSSDVAVIKGTDDLVLHPWGIEAVGAIKTASDPSLYSMPAFFGPFVWTYFALAMLALVASLFLNASIKVGRFRLPVAVVLIAAVALSYLITVGLAYWIGTMRAEAIDTKFIGRSQFKDPTSGRRVQMVSNLRDGYWLALYAGVALLVLSLARFLFVRRWRRVERP